MGQFNRWWASSAPCFIEKRQLGCTHLCPMLLPRQAYYDFIYLHMPFWLSMWNDIQFVGKDIIVFRFIIEYSSLRNFYRPLLGNNNNNRSIFIWGFLKDDILALLKLEISYNRVLISWRILVSFRGFFEDYILAWWNIWAFIILLLP